VQLKRELAAAMRLISQQRSDLGTQQAHARQQAENLRNQLAQKGRLVESGNLRLKNFFETVHGLTQQFGYLQQRMQVHYPLFAGANTATQFLEIQQDVNNISAYLGEFTSRRR
jgi:hypothetical protein